MFFRAELITLQMLRNENTELKQPLSLERGWGWPSPEAEQKRQTFRWA